jgi:hypothetical protein
LTAGGVEIRRPDFAALHRRLPFRRPPGLAA